MLCLSKRELRSRSETRVKKKFGSLLSAITILTLATSVKMMSRIKSIEKSISVNEVKIHIGV